MRDGTDVAAPTTASIGPVRSRPAPAPGPDEAVTRGEIVERVRAAVLQLPPLQRELMTALFFEESTCAEIAARFGYSIDSIGAPRGRCFRALQGTLADLTGR